jgi:hypothetical protein
VCLSIIDSDGIIGPKKYRSFFVFSLRLAFIRDIISLRLGLLDGRLTLPNLSAVSQVFSEPYVDAERAAAHLSISRKTLLRLARKGAVPGHGIGQGRKRMWRFRISELDYWMQTEVTLVSDEGRSAERKNFL